MAWNQEFVFEKDDCMSDIPGMEQGVTAFTAGVQAIVCFSPVFSYYGQQA